LIEILQSLPSFSTLTSSFPYKQISLDPHPSAMPSKSLTTIGAFAFTLLSTVSAHGIVTGIVANGAWQSGYDPSFSFQNPPPIVAGWSIPTDMDRGFVSDYTSPDIICHKGATPGGTYVRVTAGESISLQWTEWPESHHGPVIDYLAPCGEDCTSVDKTQLLFTKIDEAGLNDGSPAPGNWASDDLIANNNSWTVTIPSTVAAGKYVLRHEIIALHSAFDVGGAQNYPQCINLEVEGAGTQELVSGTKGTELYTDQDPGILLSIYYPALTNYTIPGPVLMDGSGSSSGPKPSSTPSSTLASESSAVAPTSASMSTAIAITATPSKPAAVVSPTDTDTGADLTTTVKERSTTTTTVTVTPSMPDETECTSEPDSTKPTDHPIQPGESASEVAPTGTPAPAPVPPPAPMPEPSTSIPVSFTSTVTGRIGRPTRFVCYIDDDEFTLSPA
jgi:lytic cellulose monooxygenase (C1-hydroxylating)